MGLLGSNGSQYDARQIDQELIDSVPHPEGDLLVIAPHRDGPGMKLPTGYVRGMHNVPQGGGTPPVYSHEMWFEDGEIRFVCYAPVEDDIHDTLSGQYPNATAHEQTIPTPWMEPESYVAGGDLVMELDCIFPTKTTNTEDPFETHPYGALLPKLTGRTDEHALVQTVFEPIGDSWYGRGWFGKLRGETGDGLAESIKEGHVEGEINPRVVQSDKDKDAARDITTQRNKVSFRVAIRTLAIGPSAEVAQARASKIGTIFDDYFNHVTGQGFTEQPATGDELAEHIKRIARREMPQQSGVKRRLFGADRVLTVDQLGIIANFPNFEDYPVNNLKWASTRSGGTVPHGAPGKEVEDFS